MSGSFSFGDGEGGVRSIILIVYPHDDIEVEKTFIIKLKLVKGEAKLDSRAKDVTLTVSPNLFCPQNFGFNDLLENAFTFVETLWAYEEFKVIRPNEVIVIPVGQMFWLLH